MSYYLVRKIFSHDGQEFLQLFGVARDKGDGFTR